MASKEIKVYGELVSQTLSGKTVDTDNVIDETMNMNQTEINLALSDSIDDLTNSVDNLKSFGSNLQVQLYTDVGNFLVYPDEEVTIYAAVYSLGEDITDSLPITCFRWERVSKDTEGDTIWNNLSEHNNTKSVVVTADEILKKALFICYVKPIES